MNFEDAKNKVIFNFKKEIESDLHIDGDKAIEIYKESIEDAFDEHRECFENRHNIFCDPFEEIFKLGYYFDGDNIINISIECKSCESVIFDSDIIKLDENEMKEEEKIEYIKENFDVFIEQYNSCEIDLFVEQIKELKGEE